MLIKVFSCLIISYLQIKSYNVLNYNNCSTDWMAFSFKSTIGAICVGLLLFEIWQLEDFLKIYRFNTCIYQ
jgi:hypothetical protein